MRTDKQWKDVFSYVIKETDIIIQILDSRNPLGTHNVGMEEFIKSNRPEIKIILVLNKSDIIPKKILIEWKNFFKKKGYKIFSTSAKYNLGVFNLLNKLKRMIDRPHTNILIVGYPNTGKSTLIEALTKGKKKTTGTSAKAGFTRSLQKIKLTDKIFLVDTPGVIPIDETNETEMAIKSCMIADKLEDPLAVVEAIFRILLKSEFEKFYGIKLDKNDGPEELVEKVGLKYGRLISGGGINVPESQKIIIRDWQSNKLKYYTLPPNLKSKKNKGKRRKNKRVKNKKIKNRNQVIPPSIRDRIKKKREDKK